MNLNRDATGPIIGLGGLIWACGMLFGLFLCVLWLRDGYWTSFTLIGVLGPAWISGWGGVDQIVRWIWLQPLWALISFSGISVAAFGLAAEYG
jgi:hypothetical protein